MKKITTAAEKSFYDVSNQTNCIFNSAYKYICSDVSSTIPEHYKRWKDTALVEPFTVTVFRVRWAKNNYKESA